MKAIFMIFHGFAEYNGISKKIHSQVEALRENGVDTSLCYLRYEDDHSHSRVIDDNVIEHYPCSVIGKIRKRVCYGKLVDYVKNNGIDFMYIRGVNNANPFITKMISSLHKAGVKIAYEIPTYPYDGEYKDAARVEKIELMIDKLWRRKQASKVDYIVTYSDATNIFGAKTINISNGIDFDKIILKESKRKITDEFNLIGVAELHYWHGFDRLLNGLAKYYQNKWDVRVNFHIVGYGMPDTLKELHEIVDRNGLEKYVTFHGPKFGDELTQLFNNSDMAVASLARHRSGITKIKTLKNREYAARGIPFVYSEEDDDFDNKEYVFKVSPDEMPIDIESLIDFYNNCTLSPSTIRESVSDLSWTNQMKKVIDVLFN